MKFLYIDWAESKINITYWKPGSDTDSRTMSGLSIPTAWPALAAQLRPEGKFIKRSTLEMSDEEAILGYSVYTTQVGDAMLPDPSTLSYQIVQEPIKVPTKSFKKRKAAGEICMNPYKCGTITVQRHASYQFLPIDPTVVYTPSHGWYTYYGEGYMANAQPIGVLHLGSPSYGMQPGERLRYCSVLLCYKTYSVPDAQYILSPEPIFSFEDPEVDTGLVTSVVADANNGVYDLLTELGEAPETVAFVGEMTKKALLLHEETDADLRRARSTMLPERFARYSASKWLQLRYALLPIFYSIMDIREVLKQLGKEYAEFRAHRTDTSASDVTALGSVTVTVTGEVLHRCFIKTRYSTDSVLDSLRHLINANLASTAWELTKLSFVLDWAVNVSDFLSALTGSDGSTQSVCCYSLRDRRELTLRYTDISSAPETVVTFNCYQRLIINPLDHIGLTVEFNMNWKRYIDATALSLDSVIKSIRKYL